MIQREVVYAPEALDDLLALFDRIAEAASPDVAVGYVSPLEAWLSGFGTGSERGTRRDDVRPGLRMIGFERQVTVALTVEPDRVVILRLFYGGQDWSTAFARS